MMETTITRSFESSDVQEPPSRGHDVTTDIADPKVLLDVVTNCLDLNKAEDITVIDLADKTSIADYMVVASGRSGRQVGALSDYLIRELKDHGILPKVEGKANSDWVIVDAASIVVHLFRPEVRSFYNLEKMWSHETSPEEVAVQAPFVNAHSGETATGASRAGMQLSA